MKRYFAIGDTHGHYDEVVGLYNTLLKDAGLNADKDTLIFLGDYVDGGKQVKQLLDQLILWQQEHPHWRFLLGNHDEIMTDWISQGGKYKNSSGWDIWLDQGGRETIQSYFPEENFEGVSPLQMRDFAMRIPKEHVEWLKNRQLYYETDKYFFIHAGLRHALKIENFKKRILENTEEAKILKSEAVWIRDEFINSPFDWGKKIVYGHTATWRPDVQENKIGIDTMPRDKGVLTAVCLPDETFYHFPEPNWLASE